MKWSWQGRGDAAVSADVLSAVCQKSEELCPPSWSPRPPSPRPGHEAPVQAVGSLPFASANSDGLEDLFPGDLMMYLSAEHILGSGVRPVPRSYAQELLQRLAISPSQAANPAHAARLRSSTLIVQAGPCRVEVPLFLSSVTIAEKAHARGHTALAIEVGKSAERCWVFQVNAHAESLQLCLERLFAAGAVLNRAVQLPSSVTVCETSRSSIHFCTDDTSAKMQAKQHRRELPLRFCIQQSFSGKAVKILKSDDGIQEGALEEGLASDEIGKEFKMLLQAQGHQNILILHGLFRCIQPGSRMSWGLLTEQCGSLRHDLLTSGRKSELQAQILAQQLLGALEYIHSRGIVHRDIKLDHLFLREKDLVVAGFRSATDRNDHACQRAGTAGYMAPEVIRYEGAQPVSDIFSAGVVLFMLLCGSHPFGQEDDPVDFLEYHTVCSEVDLLDTAFQSASGDCCSFLLALLSKNAADRPTASEALQDAWFTQHSSPDSEATGPTSLPRKRGSKWRASFDMLRGSGRSSSRRPSWTERKWQNLRHSLARQDPDAKDFKNVVVAEPTPLASSSSARRIPALSRFHTWWPGRRRQCNWCSE